MLHNLSIKLPMPQVQTVHLLTPRTATANLHLKACSTKDHHQCRVVKELLTTLNHNLAAVNSHLQI